MNKIKFDYYKDLPGYQNLDAEQKAIADRWDVERKAMRDAIEAYSTAEKANDVEACKAALEQMVELDTADMCEHERHWSSNCAGCDEVERICLGLDEETYDELREQAFNDDGSSDDEDEDSGDDD